MRLLATLAASAALATFATSAALADPSGYVGISGGLDNLKISYGGDSETADGSALQFLASGVYMFTPVLGVQGDIRAAFRTYEQDELEIEDTSLDGAVHGFYREEDQFLVGAFFQFGGNQLSSDMYELDVSRKYAGAEAQVYLDNLTLYGQLGLQQSDLSQEDLSLPMDGWFGSVEARYFLTPDLRIEAHVGASVNEISYLFETATLTTVNVGIGAEYKLENLPVSLFATYDLHSTTADYDSLPGDSPTFDEHRLLVGVKFAIGEESLYDRDRSGASLKPVESTFQNFSGPPVP